MIAPIAQETDLEMRIQEMFAAHPQDELQLLDIAAKAHISGRLSNLRHAADALVETGVLRLASHHGGRYYKLAQ